MGLSGYSHVPMQDSGLLMIHGKGAVILLVASCVINQLHSELAAFTDLAHRTT